MYVYTYNSFKIYMDITMSKEKIYIYYFKSTIGKMVHHSEKQLDRFS